MTFLTLYCHPNNYDESTATCSSPEWRPDQGLLPPLTVSDALAIGSAIVAVWTLGFGFKIIRKFLFK